jgi:NAD(P)-dependent dehydrogenase (short-subunit alcohol dehydrogenase family)
MAERKALSQIGAYCMGRAAVVRMTRAMAAERGKFGINFNAPHPGWTVSRFGPHGDRGAGGS